MSYTEEGNAKKEQLIREYTEKGIALLDESLHEDWKSCVERIFNIAAADWFLKENAKDLDYILNAVVAIQRYAYKDFMDMVKLDGGRMHDLIPAIIMLSPQYADFKEKLQDLIDRHKPLENQDIIDIKENCPYVPSDGQTLDEIVDSLIKVHNEGQEKGLYIKTSFEEHVLYSVNATDRDSVYRETFGKSREEYWAERSQKELSDRIADERKRQQEDRLIEMSKVKFATHPERKPQAKEVWQYWGDLDTFAAWCYRHQGEDVWAQFNHIKVYLCDLATIDDIYKAYDGKSCEESIIKARQYEEDQLKAKQAARDPELAKRRRDAAVGLMETEKWYKWCELVDTRPWGWLYNRCGEFDIALDVMTKYHEQDIDGALKALNKLDDFTAKRVVGLIERFGAQGEDIKRDWERFHEREGVTPKRQNED